MMDFSLITDEPLNYCVYAHVNKQNGKVYVGITCRLKHRWDCDGYYYKTSTKFYRAIQKYGWDNFDHIVLIDNIPESMAYIFEEELIAKYDTQESGYNILSGGNNCGPTGKKIYQYDLDGNYIGEWKNALIASESTNTDHHSLCRCAREERSELSSGGFQWRYYKKDKIPPYSTDHRRYKGAILQYSLDGVLIKRYDNIYIDNHFSEKNIHHILSVCNNKTYYAYKSVWFWEDEFDEKLLNNIVQSINGFSYEGNNSPTKKVYRYSLDGHLLNIFGSVYEAEELTGVHAESIQGACSRPKKRHYTNNYLWYYYEDCHGEDVPPFDGVGNKRKLYQYSLDGKFIKEYESIASANSIYRGLASKLKRNNGKIHNDFLWFREFKGDYVDMGGELTWL